MPRYIMKLKDDKSGNDYYLEWSTVVDAPVTPGMLLEEFKEYYKEEYGNNGMEILKARLERVEEKGISAHPPFDVLEEYFESNRAGEKESTLNKKQIIEKYCLNRPHA